MINGEITHEHRPGRTDYLYRVSLKALIQNEAGEILVVKETGRDWWDLPGGGMDFGESIKSALVRELNEEISLTGDFEYRPVLVEDPHHLEEWNLNQMRIVFLVKPENMDFKAGPDADEMKFINPVMFEKSELATERRIFEYSKLLNS